MLATRLNRQLVDTVWGNPVVQVRLCEFVNFGGGRGGGGLTVPGEPGRGKSVCLDKMLAVREDLVVIGPYSRGAEQQG